LTRFSKDPIAPEWVGLGEASRLLGVAPATLRRWSDTGRIPTFTTPGGHRRYRASTLAGLLPSEHPGRALAVRSYAPPPRLGRSAMTPARLARAYRAEAREAVRALPWLRDLDEEQLDWFRAHGRRVASHLLAHLDAEDRIQARHHLAEAVAEAASYGRFAAALGASLSGAVEGFLQFRRPFLHELAAVVRRRSFDVAMATRLFEDAERAMDSMLTAAMTAHSVAGLVPAQPPTQRPRTPERRRIG
jgi:hypothetical protein